MNVKSERWDEWECPNCGQAHDDPETILHTCCGKCNHAVLLWWDSQGHIYEVDDLGLMEETKPIY